jgi:hypothetical protein
VPSGEAGSYDRHKEARSAWTGARPLRVFVPLCEPIIQRQSAHENGKMGTVTIFDPPTADRLSVKLVTVPIFVESADEGG